MSVFIRKLSLGNYRSIAQCEVELGPVTFLVGANGSGKSNFVDALAFVSDSLQTTLDQALRARGGFDELRHRSADPSPHISIRLDVEIDEVPGHYAMRITMKGKGWAISREECRLGPAFFSVRDGVLAGLSDQVMPPAQRDRLYLTNAAGLPSFRPVYDGLLQLGIYSMSPDRIRELQVPEEGTSLTFRAGNLASVVADLDRPERQATKQRVLEYLQRVTPEVADFHARRIGPRTTIEFSQAIEGTDRPWPFLAQAMSDGTLHALAVLVALFQDRDTHRVRLVGIEEPETALHPAAARVLRDAILEASEHTQVIITSHSAELLDDRSIDATMLRAVASKSNRTVIGAVDDSTRTALHDHLFTAGELLRVRHLEIDPAADATGSPRFFEGDVP